MERLKCEELERREVPTTLADVLPHFDPITYIRPMPDVPAESVLVASYDADPLDPSNDIQDIFVAHGDGYAARVAIKAPGTSGAIVADFYAFDPEFRGGGESLTVVGTEVYVTPGDGGGPVVAAIDLNTHAVRTFAVPGFAPSWRGGLRLASFDVDWIGGLSDQSPDPAAELIVLAAAPGGGPVVSILHTDGTSARTPFLFSDPDGRNEWGFVPAAVGVLVAPGKVGMLLESARDPLTTVRVGWDGAIYPDPTLPDEFAAAL